MLSGLIECEQSKLRYLEALRVLNRSHTVLNRQYLCECKRQYKSLIRKKKRRYEMMKLDKLEQLRHSKPRDFWKYFKNKSNANSTHSIPLNSFHNYFSNLENELFQNVNDDVESFCLKTAITQLKRNKSHGIYNLLNEYFIECSDILSPYLCKLFNAALDSGCFPDV